MTELVWDGKFDKDGKKSAPVRIALPFQVIETVNESVQERQKSLEFQSTGFGSDPEWRNRLIWGDKKYVLPSLLPEFSKKINLIYIDPPFNVGADFTNSVAVPESDEEFAKQPSILEQKAYRDTWGKGLDSYLQWFYETAVLLRELLAENGSIYVHLDWHVSHYAKAVLDEVFGYDAFQREIVWRIGWISGYKSIAKNWIRNHDVIFFYTKNKADFVFNKKYIPYPADYARRGEDGLPLDGKGYPMEDVWNANEFEFALKGEESLDSIQIKSFSREKTGYATQKNESLLKRIIEASSNPGDLVLDCFSGSGSTIASAEKLGRRWIGCDLGRFSIQTCRKRLLAIDGIKPFTVQNLGKYERQAWQIAEFEDAKDQARKDLNYRRFILDLYHAQPVSGHAWLHGVKRGRSVHVGSVDAPVTLADVKAIAAEVWRAAGNGGDAPKKASVDILGWDFALEVNEVARQVAAEAKVDVAFKVIPREVLEKKAVEQGDIKFFELASMELEAQKKGLDLKLKLVDFILPPQDVPEDVMKAVTHWAQWIDYWAIDWDYKDDTFHNQWQSYRSRQKPKLDLQAEHSFEGPGEYRVVVKVIDILGNDTTRAMTLAVR